ncbi:MAG: NUDIX hydrolase [Magnetococcales bacterium]|nr:NUDIX hydrolase [Magnetococcales bacterium]
MIIRPGGLIVHAGRLLLMRYVYGGEERLNLPGGKPDPGEDLRQCLRRELREELNLVMEVGELVFLVESEGGGREVLHPIFAVVGPWQSEPCLNPLHTSADSIRWLEASALRQATLYPHIPEEVACWLSGERGRAPYLGRISQPWVS